MKKQLSVFLILAGLTISSLAQVSVNTDGSEPDPSAMLDVKSTTSGVLVPRMTFAERDAIVSPATGLLVFCTDNNQFYSNRGTPAAPVWTMVSSMWLNNGTSIYYSDGNIGIGTSTPHAEMQFSNTLANRRLLFYEFANNDHQFCGFGLNTNTLRYQVSSVAVSHVFYAAANVSSSNELMRIVGDGRVGIGTSNPNAAARLEVASTNRGFLPPRMTGTQMEAIATPPEGLLVYNTTVSSLYWYSGSMWKKFNDFTYTETDPVFAASAASSIASTDITNWNAAFTGRLTSALGTSPLTLDFMDTQLTGSIQQAGFGTDGYLSSADWNMFNDKISSQWLTNSTKLYYNMGNVGVGTSNPQNDLDVEGKMVIGSNYAGIISAPSNGLIVEGSLGIGTSNPASSAILEINSTTAGVLMPRLTSIQIIQLPNAINGLVVFNSTTSTFFAYISATNSWKEILFGTTSITPTCGTYTKNHIAGAVAPVTKTVIYGTIRNLSGEPTKCWIDRNLGASQQPTSANDATEPSAGWYWQFNLKQGYKHDGTSRTPNTVWITNINQTTDWLSANDPCTIELNSPWRIPTYTEWFNVDNANGWVNWNGPWNVGLKVHAAGVLNETTGSLVDRGLEGFYFSSSRREFDPTYAHNLSLSSTGCGVIYNNREWGSTIRCIK